ncbi:hypothetical protein RhiirA4_461275 [Rhizophagus irregularis]|uniref:Uncharacterized protein n=1 Tax=Rhizophagus irregularis TaxID=588596 RepID=A0A2I1GIH9_9GLOM|nr:hypothetical protein RhiirA4_461275 [Rhizophagus irregularis]
MWETINTISSIGYSAYIKTENCLHIYNIDDYHDIYEKRKPDTIITLIAKHFSTCVDNTNCI